MNGPHDDFAAQMLNLLFPHDSRWKATSATGRVIVGRVRDVTEFSLTLHTWKDVQIPGDHTPPRDVVLSFEGWTFEPHPFSARPVYAP